LQQSFGGITLARGIKYRQDMKINIFWPVSWHISLIV